MIHDNRANKYRNSCKMKVAQFIKLVKGSGNVDLSYKFMPIVFSYEFA